MTVANGNEPRTGVGHGKGEGWREPKNFLKTVEITVSSRERESHAQGRRQRRVQKDEHN